MWITSIRDNHMPSACQGTKSQCSFENGEKVIALTRTTRWAVVADANPVTIRQQGGARLRWPPLGAAAVDGAGAHDGKVASTGQRAEERHANITGCVGLAAVEGVVEGSGGRPAAVGPARERPGGL